MRKVLRHPGLRLIFAANMISMIGSGMNTSGVTWYVLQTTHSETALGTLLMLQTIPAMLMLPFSGVVIDREDRRRLVMVLDAARAIVILLVAVLVLRGLARLWEIYLMSILVSAGFWMFWPTMNALIQELTPESEFIQANSLLIAGLQGGWLIAGSMVGFVYNSIGLSGVLIIDCASYVLSFACYLFVRKGRHTVAVPSAHLDKGQFSRFFHELREGIVYIRHHPRVLLTGIAWALFLGAMYTQGVITAPFSDRILKAGAIGYGWLNGGWAIGAFLSAMFTPLLIRTTGRRRAMVLSMAILGASLISLPWVGSHVHGGFRYLSFALLACVLIYSVMGCCRALGGVAITSTMMDMVPKHFMGRVQNTFYFSATCLQLVLAVTVGTVSHNRSLTWGYVIVGSVYVLGCLASTLRVKEPQPFVPENAETSAAGEPQKLAAD